MKKLRIRFRFSLMETLGESMPLVPEERRCVCGCLWFGVQIARGKVRALHAHTHTHTHTHESSRSLALACAPGARRIDAENVGDTKAVALHKHAGFKFVF